MATPPPQSSVPAPKPRRLAPALAALVLALGAAGRVAEHLRAERPGERAVAEGAVWRAFDRAGAPLVLDAGSGEAAGDVLLTEESRLRLAPRDGADQRVERATFEFVRLAEEAVAELRFRQRGADAYVLRLGTASGFGVTLLSTAAGEKPLALAPRPAGDLVGKAFAPVRVELALSGPRIEIAVNGQPAVAVTDSRHVEGEVELAARYGPLRVTRLAVAGHGPSGPFSADDELDRLPPLSPLPIAARALADALAALLLALAFLRGVCLGRPTLRALFLAAGLFLGPLALAAATALAGAPPLPPFAAPALLLLGALPALFPLRESLRAPAPARPRDRLRVALVALGLAAAAGAGAFGHRARMLEPWRKQAEIAAGLAAPEPFFLAAADLGPENAITARGPWRDFDLSARVRLEPGALLELRTRAERLEGVALLLSARPDAATEFVREERDAFVPIGRSAPALAAGEHEITLRARGDRYELIAGGSTLASAGERLFTAGDVVLLAASGRARVEDLRIAPVAGSTAPPSAVIDVLAAGVAPAFGALLLALGAAWFLRQRVADALSSASFALLPVALLFAGLDGGKPAGAAAALGAALGAVLFPLLHGIVHAKGAGAWRFYAFGLAAVSAGVLLYLAARERAWPADKERENAITYVEWDGAAIPQDLLHFRHPLLRRWNDYLIDHRFRGRSYALAPATGTRRWIAVGTSSTYGYGAKDDYPSIAEALWRAAPDAAARPPLEVLNAAYPGATGRRLFQFYSSVLARFAPDVVTLSLTYNDAVNLSQFDEERYLERIAEPGFRRSVLGDLREKIAITLGARRFEALDRQFLAGAGSSLELWPAGPLSPPSERFERLLADYAERARAAGAALVLIREPIAGDKPRVWKDEFYAAMDRVAERYGLAVVDPRQALEAAGGARLFMDPIHPYAEGHRVVAAEVVKALRGIVR